MSHRHMPLRRREKKGQKKSSYLVSFALPQMYICFEKLQTILLLTY